MAKGIPLMGRDPDGKAKMINVDENGNVKVQQSGAIALLVQDIAVQTIDAEATRTFELSNLENYRYLRIAIRCGGGSGDHDYSIGATIRDDNNLEDIGIIPWQQKTVENDGLEGALNRHGACWEIPVHSKNMKLILRNNTTAAKPYWISITGVR